MVNSPRAGLLASSCGRPPPSCLALTNPRPPPNIFHEDRTPYRLRIMAPTGTTHTAASAGKLSKRSTILAVFGEEKRGGFGFNPGLLKAQVARTSPEGHDL